MGSFFRRVLRRLEQAEALAQDPQLQENYRLAWLTVLYAAQGHRESHVEAFYSVFGLHPSKVFAAIVARRKAKLGRQYDSFFGPQLSVEEFLKLPPRKPPQAMRFGEERNRRQRAAGGSTLWPGGHERNLEKQTPREEARGENSFLETPEMASTPLAYRNPGAPNRAKNAAPEFAIPAAVEASDLPLRFRTLIVYMLRKNQFGNELYRSQRKLVKDIGISFSTVRRIIDQLTEELFDCGECHQRGWLDQAGRCRNRKCRSTSVRSTGLRVFTELHSSNVRVRGKFRRSATFELHREALTRRQMHDEYERSLPSEMPKRPQSTNLPAPAPASPVPAAEPIAAPQPMPKEKPRKLTSRECSKLVALVKVYKRGRTYLGDGREGIGRKLFPGDPEYVAPLSQADAIVAACKELGTPIESAVEALKLAGWGNA